MSGPLLYLPVIRYKNKLVRFILNNRSVCHLIKAEKRPDSLNFSLVLLADFGLSKIVEHQVLMKTVCGTPGYCGMLFNTDVYFYCYWKSIFV